MKEFKAELNETTSQKLVESGKLKMISNNYLGAVSDFNNAIGLDPTNIAAYKELVVVKLAINDIIGAQKDFDTGNKIYEELEKGLNAKDEGNFFYEVGDYKSAIKSYNRAILYIPNVASTYYYRGCSKMQLNDYLGALEDFDKIINSNTCNKADAYYQRSLIKSQINKDKVGAITDINNAIEYSAIEAEYYFHRASLLDGDKERLQDLNKAIDLEPQNADYYLERGRILKSIGDKEGTLSDAKKYLEARISSYNFEPTLREYDNAINENPFNSNALLKRAMLKYTMMDYEGAIIDFDKVIELEPLNGEAYFVRGQSKKSIGQHGDGMFDLNMATLMGYENII